MIMGLKWRNETTMLRDIYQNVKSDNAITAKDMGTQHMSVLKVLNVENVQGITNHESVIRIQKKSLCASIAEILMMLEIIKNVQEIKRKRSAKH